jgi:hypothetical protein
MTKYTILLSAALEEKLRRARLLPNGEILSTAEAARRALERGLEPVAPGEANPVATTPRVIA